MNSYKKLKTRNKELLRDIRLLIEDNNFMRVRTVQAKYRMLFGMAEHVLFGSRNTELVEIDSEITKRIFDQEPFKLTLFKTNIHKDVDDSFNNHKLAISKALVYGKASKHTFEPIHSKKLYMWSGFLERYGRLPTVEDNICLIYGNKYFIVEDGYVVSELAWMLVK